MNNKIESIKKQADKIIKFENWKASGLCWTMGAMYVAQNGYFTYVSTETKEKIFIEK